MKLLFDEFLPIAQSEAKPVLAGFRRVHFPVFENMINSLATNPDDVQKFLIFQPRAHYSKL